MVTRALALAAALAAGCSYGGSFVDCRITCASAGDCPDGFACGGEGLCRASGVTATCMAVLDALGDTAPPDDVLTSSRCTGTPRACGTYTGVGACNNQAGCQHQGAACVFTFDCTTLTTAAACAAHMGCATDVGTSTCQAMAGYCTGNNQNQCESKPDCSYLGGCMGTAAACNTRTTQQACTKHDGCSWE